MKILVVEDNQILSNNIHAYLKLKNIESKQFFEWKAVNYELTNNDYDAVILDLWLPDIDGLEVATQIRKSWKNIPILMLTARSNIKDKLSGFDSWADDYLTKPFDYEELLMRINALVRRNQTIKSNNIKLDNFDIEIDINTKKILLKNKEIHLSKLELNLLIYLVNHKWTIISKERLLEKVWWEYDEFGQTRTVDVYVWYLRKKLWKSVIETVRWSGYIIN